MSDAECSSFSESECSASSSSEGCLKLYDNSTYIACASLCTVAETEAECVGTPTTGPYGCMWLDNNTCSYVVRKPPPLLNASQHIGPFLTCTKLEGNDSSSCDTTKTGTGACSTTLNTFRAAVLVSLALCVTSFGLLIPVVMGKRGSGRFVSVVAILLILGTLFSIISSVLLPKVRSKECINRILPNYAAAKDDAALSYSSGLLFATPVLCFTAAVVTGYLRWHRT